MQAVTEVVLRELVLHTVQREFALTDAVGVTANRSTEVRRDGLVARDLVKAQHHVAQLARAVGYHHRYDAATEGGDAYLHAVGILQGVELGRLIADRGLEIGRIETRQGRLVLLRAAAHHQRGSHEERRNFADHSYAVFIVLVFGEKYNVVILFKYTDYRSNSQIFFVSCT